MTESTNTLSADGKHVISVPPKRIRQTLGDLRGVIAQLQEQLREQQRNASELFNEAKRCQMVLAEANNAHDTKVSNLNSRVAEQSLELDKLRKELESVKQSKSWTETAHKALNTELEQAHLILDGVPGVMPRQMQVSNNGYSQDVAVGVGTRFASYMALLVRGGGQ